MGPFENFRACLNGVTVLTYDELLCRVDDLLGILATDDGAGDFGAAGAKDCASFDGDSYKRNGLAMIKRDVPVTSKVV